MERALTRWPDQGIPANPEGWVLTVACNRLRDRWKSHSYRMAGPLPETDSAAWGYHDDSPDPPAIPDRRLELMLVCANPAIAANCRTPLSLQTVLGIDSAAIRSAHCARAHSGRVDWLALRKLHRELLRIAPSLGAAVSLAVVDGEARGRRRGCARSTRSPTKRSRASSRLALRVHICWPKRAGR